MSDALRELLASFSIEVETDELEKGEKETDDFVGKLKEFGKVVAEAFAVHEVKEFIESQIEAGAQLKVTAERLGTDTTELQAMQLAAGEAGVSVDAMTTGLRFLNRNIAEANSGSAEQATLFRKMGIALKDSSGEVRPAGDVMQDLADHIAKIPDAATKTQVAMKLLGRGGAELIPLLNKGGAAFEQARKDLVELGGGLGEDFVEAAHKAEEANVRLEFAMKGLKSTVALELLPGFEKIVSVFTDVVKGAIDLEKRSHIMEDALDFLKAGAVVAGVLKLVQGMRALASAEGLATLMSPFTWWVIGIGLALLAYNDLKTALDGGKSVFGDIFGHTGIESLRQMMREAADVADVLGATLGTVADFLETIGDLAGFAGSKLSSMAHSANAAIAGAVRAITGSPESDQSRAASAADQAASAQAEQNAQEYSKAAGAHRARTSQRWDEAGASILSRDDAATRIVGAVGTPGGGTSGPQQYLGRQAVGFSRDGGAYGDRNQPRLAGQGNEAIGRNENSGVVIHQQNSNTVNVHTSAQDAKGIGKEVGSAVATEQQRVNNNAKIAMAKP